MRRVALYLAAICLALSLVVNVASYFGISLFERFVFLHLGIFVLALPAVPALARRLKGASWWPPGAGLRALTEGGPSWGPKVLAASYVYFLVQFVALWVLSDGGTPSHRDGRYVLHSHGRLLRELTEAEYSWQLSHVARMFSAGWVAFYVLLVIWYWAPGARPTEAKAQRAS